LLYILLSECKLRHEGKSFTTNKPYSFLEQTEPMSKRVRNKSKRNRAIFGLSYLSSATARRILRHLGEEMPQSEIAKLPSFTKQKVNYWTLKFLSQGLIKEKSSGKPKFYTLTALGQKILTGSERAWQEPCVMEDYAVKFRLVKDHGLIDWKKLGKPQNWVKLGVQIGNVKVEKNLGKQTTVIVRTGQLSGFSPDHLLVEAGSITEAVRAILKDKGVELDPVGVCIRQPKFKFFNPESEILNKQYGSISTEEGDLDHSPPDDIAHVEWNRETAKNYLEMPNRLERVEKLLLRQLEFTQKDLESRERQVQLAERQLEATERNTEALEELSKSSAVQPRQDRLLGVV
jgi:hypothetical protein